MAFKVWWFLPHSPYFLVGSCYLLLHVKINYHMLTMLLSTKSLKVHITECKFAFAREIIYVSAKLFHANEFILASKIICPRRHEEHKLTIHICHKNNLTVSENKQCVEYSMTHEYFWKFQYVNLFTLGVSVLQDSALIYKKKQYLYI